MTPHSIGDIICNPPRMSEDSDFVAEVREKCRRFDEYEERERQDHIFHRCNHCNPAANLFPESELFWDDEHGYLCERCLKEAEADREAEDEERRIMREEEREHYGE